MRAVLEGQLALPLQFERPSIFLDATGFRERHKGSYVVDPETCDQMQRLRTMPNHAFCKLAGVFVNCPVRGCYTTPSGGACKEDNSADACAARLERIRQEQSNKE